MNTLRPNQWAPRIALSMMMLMGIAWRICSADAGGSPVPAAKNRQIDAGIALYKERCVQCHSENLAGGAGPPLKGDDFLSHWKGMPLRSLYSRILATMPQNDPGSLEPAEVLSLVAYIASEDSLANWETAFKSADELSAITMDQHK